MALRDARWVQMGDPATPAEAHALQAVRQLLPDTDPTQAWANVTFRDRDGRAGEIDLLLLHRNGIYVLELKGWHGTITGNQTTWTVTSPQGHSRVERDPFHVARGKAQRLGDELRRALARRNVPGRLRPFVHAVVVLHGSASTVQLSEQSAATTYALDGYGVTGLRPLSELLAQAPDDERDDITPQRARPLLRAIADLGLVATPKTRMVGPFALESLDPVGEGPGWVDVRARHPVLTHDYRRIRLFDLPAGATAQQRATILARAKREHELTTRLDHPSVVRSSEIYDTDAGPALVFPDDADRVPIARYLADERRGADVRHSLLRQLAEVVDHAHRHGVQHRALAPACVHVRTGGGPGAGAPTLFVRDWQAGHRDRTGDTSHGTTTSAAGTVGGIPDLVVADALLYLAPESHQPSPAAVPLDVYGLGALAYLILTDAPPAENLAELQERLRAGGLDPAVARDGLAPALCDLVRHATDPDLVRRTPSVAAFLDELSAAEQPGDGDDKVPVTDPREAGPGTMLAGRWEVKQALGSGGSGIALLVDDYETGDEAVVLKVAHDDAAAERLRAEAEVLATLDSPRVVRIIDGPFEVHGQTAILLEDAGRPTLARRLQDEGRLTLEQLQGYGRDLFEAMAHLEERKVFHRDVKPDNLGVRASRADRSRHLVLFDFSLAREPVERTRSGTAGFVDPFLGGRDRPRYDSAAEWFAVAATLFEMATGTRPAWGDGQSDPALVADEVHLAATAFEPEVADGLVDFFRRALARDVGDRFDDLAAMAHAWDAVFPASRASRAQDAPEPERDAAADKATLATPLGRAGLTARAVSAARRLGLETVQALVDAHPFAINTEPGIGVLVRSELQRRRRQWRARLVDGTSSVEEALGLLLRGVETTQEALVPGPSSRAAAAAALARRLLCADDAAASPGASPAASAAAGPAGPEPAAVVWPDHARAAADAGVPAEDRDRLLNLLIGFWSRSRVMPALRADVLAALGSLGGTATVDEVAERVRAVRGSSAEGAARWRNAIGLVRAVVEADTGADLAYLRHGDRVVLTTATEGADARLDAVAALAAAVDTALDAAASVTAAVAAGAPGPPRGSGPLGPGVGLDLVRRHPRSGDLGIADPQRVLTLAARASATAAVSSRGELYPRGMPAPAGVAAVLAAVPARVGPDRLRTLVAVRFPSAASAPDRPDLDRLVRAAAPYLGWDPDEGAYTRPETGTGSLLSSSTALVAGAAVAVDETDAALRASLAARAATVVTTGHHRLSAAPAALAARFGVTVVDVTAELLHAMRDRARAAGVAWDLVLRADAAPAGTTDRANLDRLVADATERFWPGLLARPDPLLLVGAAPLARYGQLKRLAVLLDTATERPAARWLLVPKRAGAPAPTLDGTPIPAASGTWVELPAWPDPGTARKEPA